MIFYNMRYRGPYEYDKFVLNTLQHYNITKNFINDTTGKDSWKTLYDIQKQIDTLFDSSTSVKGFSEQIYKNFIMNGDD